MDLHGLLINHLDGWWQQYRVRIEGITDAEHLWSPADGCTVRLIDGVWRPDPHDHVTYPPPFASIAWRMWHIAVDCLDSYSLRAFGASGSGLAADEWVGTAGEALDRSDAAWKHFRQSMASLDEPGWQRAVGPDFGPFAEHSHVALALHAHAEVTHHGAEVALLRDLYREILG